MSLRILTVALCLFSILLGIIPVCTMGQTTNRVPFTAEGIESIPGRNICDFEGKYFEGSDVYLDRGKNYSVDERQRNRIDAVFLLSKPTEHCGIVESSLDLTHLIRNGESVEFKCYTAHEGGTTWPKWGHIIGLADNHNGLKRFVKARLAWRVNIKEKRFEELKGTSVTCDTSGYDD
jgi:hypothetical protein